jgi:hypothetical protein
MIDREVIELFWHTLRLLRHQRNSDLFLLFCLSLSLSLAVSLHVSETSMAQFKILRANDVVNETSSSSSRVIESSGFVQTRKKND